MQDTPTVDSILTELRSFVAEREWATYHNVKNLSMLLASECGELVALLRWLGADEADARVRGALASRFADELGDVGIAWLLLCDRAGVDPLASVRSKLDRNRRNYPADLSRGRPERPADAPLD